MFISDGKDLLERKVFRSKNKFGKRTSKPPSKHIM